MIKKIMVLLILISFNAIGQNQSSDILTHTSKKGLYKISYNSQNWKKSNEATEWDAEFNDKYNLTQAFFIEYDYFITENKIKSLKSQFKNLGKIKNLKTYKKKINDLDVDYFEFELSYDGLVYIFQGFNYSGKGGSIEMQFRYQKECSDDCQKRVNEFYSGLEIIE